MDRDVKNSTVCVLWGGWAEEREISHDSALAVASALRSAGFCSVTLLDLKDEATVPRLASKAFDVVFVAMHGCFGEDGCVQGLLEILHIPYTFSGVRASAMAADKEISRSIFEHAGIPVAKGLVFRDASKKTRTRILDELKLPIFVKPAVNGSSYGITKVKCAEELSQALELALESCDHGIAEEAIDGIEITVPVIGAKNPRALQVIEVVPNAEFYDRQVKYEPSELHHVIPARLDSELIDLAKRLAVLAHTTLGCWGASRSDFIVNEEGVPVILEINTIPGMTLTSLLPDSAQRSGISFPELVSQLVEWAYERPSVGLGAKGALG